MRGRKPKPTAVRALHGNVGHRALNKSEPKFSGAPSCPTWLTKEAKREWKRIVSELAQLDMLRSTDQAALAAYCQSFGRWMTAEQLVSKEGQTVNEPITNKTGEIVGYRTKRHPATTIAREERAAMLKSCSLFGFDPSSRSRIVMPEPKEQPTHDDFDDNLFADNPEDTGRSVH